MTKETETTSTEYPWLTHYPEGIDWNAAIEVSPVADMLDSAVETHGDSYGFDFLGARQTWAEIDLESRKIAKGFQEMGFQKGQRVGLFLPNCPLFLTAYYGLLRIGVTVVNYNPLYAERELADMIEDSETDAIITLDLELLYGKMEKMLRNTRLDKLIVTDFTQMLPFPKNVLFRLFKSKERSDVAENNKRIVPFSDLVDNDGNYNPVDIVPEDDVALLQFTGGTTGIPKAAMLTHANIVANTIQASQWLGCKKGEDRMLGAIPFFHVFAMTAVMNMAVRNAMEIIALPRFDLKQTLELIHKKKPTIFPAVPAIFNGINNNKNTHKFDLTSLKFCISGGAPLPIEVKKKFEEKTGAVLVEGYGLTESAPVLCCNPREGKNKAGSIGMPFPGTLVEIIDPDTGEKVAMGERGELCARGPQVMKGYWNRPEENGKTLQDDGRLHTGDIAKMDEDGYFFIVDRIKDMIITNGYNVYPRNVEEAIYMHPSVEECIVAGLPDSQRGEIVKAWIKCREGRTLTAEDLKVFLEDKISPIEIPKRIEFRDTELPKTMIGKLSRKDIVAEELAEKD